MLNIYNRKDALPEETIKRIKKMLKDNKIKVKESKIININNSVFSVRLELKSIPGVGTNGKGITKEYALASAYAEFMERLQTKFLLKATFLNKENEKKAFCDEFYMDYNEFIKNEKIVKNDYIDELMKNNADYCYITPFYDLLNDCYINLPVKVINLLTHSNGLSSGNTKEEALVQGICEIFERFCYKEIMFKELELPTIMIDDIETLNVYEHLQHLNKLGFSYEIKDCSLNGKFPVVGIIIYDSTRKKYLFSIGADPDFNIALQRCITEILQGISAGNIENKMKSLNNEYENNKCLYGKEFLLTNWLQSYSSNTGIHPKSLFTNKEKINLSKLSFYEVKDNKQALDILLNIIRKEGLKIYIKDYSYFGFDTYRTYIPTLSEIDELDTLKYELSCNINQLREMYFNLSNPENVLNNKLEKILFQLSTSKRYRELILPNNVFNVNNCMNCDYINLNFFYILLIKLFLTKNYSKAIEYINITLKNEVLGEYEREYLNCIKSILNRKDYLKKYSKIMFNDSAKLIYNTEKYLRSLNAPTCPNCNNCKSRCKYKEWKYLNEMIFEKSKSYMKQGK